MATEKSKLSLCLPATRGRLGQWDARGPEGPVARRPRLEGVRARHAFGAARGEAVEVLLEERGTQREELLVVLDEPRVVLHKVGRHLRRVRPRLRLWPRAWAWGLGPGAWAGAGAAGAEAWAGAEAGAGVGHPVGARVGLMRVRHGALRPTEEAVEHAGRLVEARRHPYEAILAQQVPHRTTQMRRACAARARGININISTKPDTKVDAHARLQAGARARREVVGGDGGT